MTAPNPYQSPATPPQETEADTSHLAVAPQLRERYFNRETTLRALGLAALVVGLLRAYHLAAAQELRDLPYLAFAMFGLAAVRIACAAGLVGLVNVGRLGLAVEFAILQSVALFALAVGLVNFAVANQPGGLSAGALIVNFFALAILFLLTSSPSADVCGRRYREVVRATRSSGIRLYTVLKALPLFVVLYIVDAVLLFTFLAIL